MYLLDTNVISELIRPQPDAAVVAWVAAQPLNQLYTSAITMAEMLRGVAVMPAGKRRVQLNSRIAAIFVEDFAGRILPFDDAAAICYADWVLLRQQAGRPVSQFDAQIAGIAESRVATLVTRNIRDFDGLKQPAVNPW